MDYSDLLGALTTTRSAMTSGRNAYDQALASQLGALEQPVDRRGALMRMAQGFLSPTRTGGFAENAGMAIGNYADANDKMRDQEMDRAMKLAQIQAARAKLQMEGAGQDFDLFSKGHGMMQDQRREGLLDTLYGGGPSLSGVAADASAGAGFDMPSLPGLDASGFAPGFNNPSISMTEDFNQRMREGAGERRQLKEMQRLQAESAAPQPDLPARNPTPPELLSPVPGQGSNAIDPNATAAYSSGSDGLSMPQPLDVAQSPLSPEMVITPEQMQRFQRPQPQQAAPQQSPQQQSPQAAGLTGSDAVFAAAEQQRARLQQIGQQNPEIRSLPEYRDEMNRVDDILLKGDTSLIREYRAFQNETPNWSEVAPTLAHFKRMGATNLQVGAQETEFDKEMGKNFAAQYQKVQSAAGSANDMMGLLDQVEDALATGVYTGPGGSSINAVMRVASSLGFGDDDIKSQAASGELITAVQNRMALIMRSPDSGGGMPGAVSDKDIQFLREAQVGIDKTPEGNRRLLNAFRRVEQRKLEVARMADDYIARKGRLDSGFNREVRDYANQNLLFADSPPPTQSSGSATPPPASDVDDILKRFKVLQ